MANYFSIFLVALTAASGLIWLIDSLMFAPKRRDKMAIASGTSAATLALGQDVQLPWLVDTAQQIFPIIAFVMVLRSFLYEPFQIPSGSMMPTLLVGDFILVEKFTYGLKDPVMRNNFVDIGKPERGDVVVFKFPPEPQLDYINVLWVCRVILLFIATNNFKLNLLVILLKIVSHFRRLTYSLKVQERRINNLYP
jgi:signal peptidase I